MYNLRIIVVVTGIVVFICYMESRVRLGISLAKSRVAWLLGGKGWGVLSKDVIYPV